MARRALLACVDMGGRQVNPARETHTPNRTVRVSDEWWSAAAATAEHERTTITSMIVESLRARVARGALGRLVAVDYPPSGLVGVDHASIQPAAGEPDRGLLVAIAYRAKRFRKAPAEGPQFSPRDWLTITLSADEAAQVRAVVEGPGRGVGGYLPPTSMGRFDYGPPVIMQGQGHQL